MPGAVRTARFDWFFHDDKLQRSRISVRVGQRLSPLLSVSLGTGISRSGCEMPASLLLRVSPDKSSIYSPPANGMCNAYLSGQTRWGLVAKNISR